MFELTLAIIKPHIIKQPHMLQNIRNIILNSNFKIVQSTNLCLTKNQAEQFYNEHRAKFFFNRLVTFMTSGPSDFYILGKNNAISDWRRIMGPTKVFRAQFTEPDSIRGSCGLSDTRNATHGSDSRESADREIKIFFPEFNMNKWSQTDRKYFENNRLEFNREKFIHVPKIINK